MAQRLLGLGSPHTRHGLEATTHHQGEIMELSEMTDDELLAEVRRCKAAVLETQLALDLALIEAGSRPTIKNPRIAAAAGIAERTLYKWLERAWKRGHVAKV